MQMSMQISPHHLKSTKSIPIHVAITCAFDVKMLPRHLAGKVHSSHLFKSGQFQLTGIKLKTGPRFLVVDKANQFPGIEIPRGGIPPTLI